MIISNISSFKKWVYGITLVILVIALLESLSCLFLHLLHLPQISEGAALQREGQDSLSKFHSWRHTFKPFPLFGYVNSPQSSVNNFGFANPVDYPYSKKKNEFVIGVFGGSVAEQLSYHLHEPEFLKEISKSVPNIDGKKIIILNMALPGSQQPQSFIIFSYFIEMFDLVIQLDGWNEAWIKTSAEYPLNFPAFSEVLYSEDPFLRQKLNLLKMTRSLIDGLREQIINSKFLIKSYTFSLFIEGSSRSLDELSTDIVIKKNNSVTSVFKKNNSTLALESKSKRPLNWKKYLLMEAALAASKNIPIFFFVQPSQYVPKAKPFTDQEKKIAFDMIVARDLPKFELIRKFAKNLNQKGLPVFDLNDTFITEYRDVFVDNCCHINTTGNRILMHRISREIANNWKYGHIQNNKILSL